MTKFYFQQKFELNYTTLKIDSTVTQQTTDDVISGLCGRLPSDGYYSTIIFRLPGGWHNHWTEALRRKGGRNYEEPDVIIYQPFIRQCLTANTQ